MYDRVSTYMEVPYVTQRKYIHGGTICTTKKVHTCRYHKEMDQM